jgi:AcrR family transcriptional regulator
MGRTKLHDREALLDAAMLVFWRRGFADTSRRLAPS